MDIIRSFFFFYRLFFPSLFIFYTDVAISLGGFHLYLVLNEKDLCAHVCTRTCVCSHLSKSGVISETKTLTGLEMTDWANLAGQRAPVSACISLPRARVAKVCHEEPPFFFLKHVLEIEVDFVD